MSDKKNFLKDLIKSHHIQLALAVGISIIAMSYFSKKILDKPISNIMQAIPAFIIIAYEFLQAKKVNPKLLKPLYWVVAIFFVTILIIVLQLL
jgi:Na+/H+ antiporter NhaD/arsenite permease-like protein